jgi:hypothetical protein
VEDGLGLGSGLSAVARRSISVRIYHTVRHDRRTTTIDEAERDVAHDTADLGASIVFPWKAGVRVRSRHTDYNRRNTLVQGRVDPHTKLNCPDLTHTSPRVEMLHFVQLPQLKRG